MGNCLSSRKSGDGDEDNGGQHGNNNQLPQQYPLDDFAAAVSGMRRQERGAASRSSRYRNLPLDQRPDKKLRRHVWTHDVPSEGRPPTLQALDRMREEFWHTRVTGREEIWHTVRTVIEVLMADDSEDALLTAREMLHAAEITVPSGDLTGSAYDVFGNKYKFPAYVVSNPTNVLTEEDEADAAATGATNSPRSSNDSLRSSSSYKSGLSEGARQRRRRDAKGKGPAEVSVMETRLSVSTSTAIFRLSDARDYRVEFWSDERLKDILPRLIELAEIDTRTHRLKLILGGAELDMDKPLHSLLWSPEMVITAIVQDLRIVAPHLVKLAPPPPQRIDPRVPAHAIAAKPPPVTQENDLLVENRRPIPITSKMGPPRDD
ncbi:hypothetical protein DRE_01310 [Drechslerella stenobrocha 248]|uniref:DC-UbP/UBTD2 N-terminal domain-containing protein n=1 Tax=Drechslerella stenobrocha 248 TaxID=1043628 RepID=W7HVQ9_9PEZI|nr:hypothetical protein DRE_01310 [Drechslerella stenobrocha 248]